MGAVGLQPHEAGIGVGARWRCHEIGSRVTKRRRRSSTWLMWFILSSIIAPGICGAPSTITLAYLTLAMNL
jgi:hypothetical protein